MLAFLHKFGPYDSQVTRCINTDFDVSIANLDDRDSDVVPDCDDLMFPSAQNQHVILLENV
jgi:hypothetical protein